MPFVHIKPLKAETGLIQVYDRWVWADKNLRRIDGWVGGKVKNDVRSNVWEESVERLNKMDDRPNIFREFRMKKVLGSCSRWMTENGSDIWLITRRKWFKGVKWGKRESGGWKKDEMYRGPSSVTWPAANPDVLPSFFFEAETGRGPARWDSRSFLGLSPLNFAQALNQMKMISFGVFKVDLTEFRIEISVIFSCCWLRNVK